MFGYLTVNKLKLDEKDQKIYEAYYCGLCKTLGEKFGHKSQLVLTYDLVFLAILYEALYEKEEVLYEEGCVIKTKRVSKIHSEFLSFSSDMNLMLSYHNFKDKVYDSNSKIAKTAVKLLSKEYQKLKEIYPEKDLALNRYMELLHEGEKRNEDNPDYLANLTGEMLSEVFLLKEDEFSKYLKPMFYYIGKAIYLFDAYEDVLEDIEKNSYNPYKNYYHGNDEEFTDFCKMHLEMVMGECMKAYECLPIFMHKEILNNILYSGMWIRFAKCSTERREKTGKE